MMRCCERCGWELMDEDEEVCGPCDTTLEVMAMLGEEEDY